MKKCCKCKCQKKFDEFQKEKRKHDGLSTRCKDCLNSDKREYLDTKREKIREYNKKKYHENQEENKKLKTERSKKFREEHPEEYKKIQAEWRLKNPEKVRASALLRSKKSEYKEKRNKRLRENKKESDIKKIRARKILQTAVKVGHMIRPSNCEKCSKLSERIQAHHNDYDKPLEVIWLCKICHSHKHGKLLDIEP